MSDSDDYDDVDNEIIDEVEPDDIDETDDSLSDKSTIKVKDGLILDSTPTKIKKIGVDDGDIDEEVEIDEDELDEDDLDEDAEDAEEEPEDENTSFLDTGYTIVKDEHHTEIVVRNPSNYISSNMIRKTEVARLLSIRASQIERGQPVYCDIIGLSDPIEMAKKEFQERRTPLILRRRIKELIGPDGSIRIEAEDWDPNQMTRPTTFNL